MEKWIIATGVSRGIGAELAKQIKSFDYKILHIGRASSEFEDEFLFCDLSENFSADFFKTLNISLNQKNIFGLFYSAGVFPQLAYQDREIKSTISFWDTQKTAMNVNYFACAQLVDEIIPHLSKYTQDSSTKNFNDNIPFIAHLSSLAAVDPLPYFELYGITKLATLKFFESYSKKYAYSKISCFSLHPGTVKTDMLNGIETISKSQNLPIFDILQKAHEKKYTILPEHSAELIIQFLSREEFRENRHNAHGKLYCVDTKKTLKC